MMIFLLGLIIILLVILKSGKKKRQFIISGVIVIVLLMQIPFFQRAAAFLTTQAYVRTHHYEKGLKFQHVEYSSAFGNYFVQYKSSNGELYNFQVSSKRLPISVVYDPFAPRP